MKNKGSSFDSFLKEENIYESVTDAVHIKILKEESEKLKSTLLELAPWASAAQDDPNCCKELKDIFVKVIDSASR